MQPGERIVAGSGKQTTYVSSSGQAHPVRPRESALASEALELQRQQQTAARAHVIIVATPLLPATRTHNTGGVSAVGPYYAPAPAVAATQVRAPLGPHVPAAPSHLPAVAPQVRAPSNQHVPGMSHHIPSASSQERAALGGRVKKHH